MIYGSKHSQETKNKIGNAQRGKKHSIGHIEKVRLANIGPRPSMSGKNHWNWKGGAVKKACMDCQQTFLSFPANRKKFCSRRCRAQYQSKYWRGPHGLNWQGGKTSKARMLRNSKEMKEWRRHVFQRDDWTCQACGKRGGHLEADHELQLSLYPDLCFEILNGRTLCNPCHRRTPTFGKKINLFHV